MREHASAVLNIPPNALLLEIPMEQVILPLVLAVALNLVIFGLLLMLQSASSNLPARGSDIPGTAQPFLFVQDYWTMTLGNLVGLTLIDAAFFRIVAAGYMTGGEWMVFLAIVTTGIIGFSMLNSRDEYKNDYAFPRPGEVSGAGAVMLVNFGTHAAIAVLVLWNLFAHALWGSPVMWFAVIGAAIYAVCFAIDVLTGNFDPKRPLRS